MVSHFNPLYVDHLNDLLLIGLVVLDGEHSYLTITASTKEKILLVVQSQASDGTRRDLN